MAFRGMFIGIDHYISPEINELRCARRDATALDALFTDTLGGISRLVVDEEATRARLRRELEDLADCDPGDTVVIGFSGHGSDTHELVTCDTQLYDIANTTLPLTLIEEWLYRIPARRLIFLLDCCFSGGIGAKVLQVEARPRDFGPIEARLDQLAGDAITGDGARACVCVVRVLAAPVGQAIDHRQGEPVPWRIGVV